MQKELRRRRFKLAVAVAAMVATSATARSQRAGTGEVLTADVAIGQSHVSADGQPLPGAAPLAKYRVERRIGMAGATTTLTLVELERAVAEGPAGEVRLDNPFLAARVELDPADGLRVYNRRGDLLRQPTAADRRMFGLDNLTSESKPRDTRPLAAHAGRAKLLVDVKDSAVRRADLERRFGPPVERVKGRDRYVINTGGDVDEVFLDPIAAVPYEVNTVRDGLLVSHVVMTYEARGSSLIRRSLRSERALPDTARRVVTTVDVTDVRFEAGVDQ
jgi:hypothetical protein